MTWKTLKDLIDQGRDRRSLQRAAKSGRIPAYKTSEGKWLIWQSDSHEDLSALFFTSFQETREEIQKLREELQSLKNKSHHEIAVSKPPQSGLPTAPLRISPQNQTDRDELLQLIDQTWDRSDAELERKAQAPRGWIWRQREFAKKGKPTSKRGKETRQKILKFLKKHQDSLAA